MLNGARRRCPRCGKEPLFYRWNRVRKGCGACGLRYQINRGDSHITVSLWTANSSNYPNTRLAPLARSSALFEGDLSFSAPESGISLARNITYVVVLEFSFSVMLNGMTFPQLQEYG